MTISESIPPEWGDMAGAPLLKLQRVGVTVPSPLGGEMSVVLAANFPDAPDDWVVIHAPLDKLIAAIHRGQTEIAEALRRKERPPVSSLFQTKEDDGPDLAGRCRKCGMDVDECGDCARS